jgi:hypothetical protein
MLSVLFVVTCIYESCILLYFIIHAYTDFGAQIYILNADMVADLDKSMSIAIPCAISNYHSSPTNSQCGTLQKHA